MKPQQTIKGPLALGIVGASIAVVFIVAYSIYAAFPYLAGPSITLSAKTEAGVTTLKGTTERVSFLEVNGTTVPLEEDGTYEVKRTYPTGYTLVTVSARDRFGRTITKTLTFTVEQHPPIYGSEEEN